MTRPKVIVFLFSILAAYAADHEAWKKTITETVRLIDAGDYHAAEPLADRALREAEPFGANDIRVAYSLRQVGVIHFCMGRFPEAEKALLRGIGILDSWKPAEPLAAARLYSDLGTLYGTSGGRWAQAEKALRTALRLQESALGPSDPSLGHTLANLSAALIHVGDLNASRELLERALVLIEKQPNSEATTASILNVFGILKIMEGNADQSLDYLNRCITMWRQASGKNHPDLILPLLNTGRVYLDLHRPAEALPLLREAQKIAEVSLGPSHPVLAEVLLSCAEALGKTGGRKQARELERRSQAIFKQYPGRTATVSLADLMRTSHR